MRTPTYIDKSGVRVACVVTKTGIHIGCAYNPPARPLSWDETQIQSMLIRRKPDGLSPRAWAVIGLIGAICLAWISV